MASAIAAGGTAATLYLGTHCIPPALMQWALVVQVAQRLGFGMWRYSHRVRDRPQDHTLDDCELTSQRALAKWRGRESPA